MTGLDARQRGLLTLAGIVAAALVVVVALYRPLLIGLGSRLAALRDLQAKLAEARTLSGQLAEQEHALAQAQARYAEAARRLGSDQSVARILDALSRHAKANRLELTAVQPRAGDGGQRRLRLTPDLVVTELPLNLQLTGNYRQLGEFLGMLSDAPFLASVQRLTVTKPQLDSAKLQADLVLAVYLADQRPRL